MIDKDKCCGTCEWHMPSVVEWGKDWICGNEQSEQYATYTGYEDSCEDWEDRDG